MNLIEPTAQAIRTEIEEVKGPEERMYYKALLTFGGRSVEFAGVNCLNEKAYGTIGAGYAWIDQYQPKTVTTEEMTQRLTQLAENSNANIAQIMAAMMKPPQPIKAAIFKIPIAKKHLLQGESIVYRHAAIPLDKKYEPWAQELYDYYQQRGKGLLFPNNRKHYLDYIKQRGIFKKFMYPVERYTLRTATLGKIEIVPENTELRRYKRNDKTGIVHQYDVTPQHPHKFKLHGLRHVRTKELNDFYEIKDTLALCSFIGWAPARGANAMIARYGNIYTNWGSYFASLLKIRAS